MKYSLRSLEMVLLAIACIIGLGVALFVVAFAILVAAAYFGGIEAT